MLRFIFILVAFAFTSFGNTNQNEDWKNKGFYRPRRNYQTQPRSQNDQNLNATRETGFRQSRENQKVHNYNPSHQRTNAFVSNSHKQQNQDVFERTSYNHNAQNVFGSRLNTFRMSFNQNIQRQNSFGTSSSQSQDQNPFVNQRSEKQSPFGASYNSFGKTHDLNTQSQNLIGAGYNQMPHSSNLFETGIRQNHPTQNLFGSTSYQNFQRQNSFGPSFGQNAFSYLNFGSNLQQMANSGQRFGAYNQNTYKDLDYLPPRDKPKPPFVGPTYLPPSPDKPLVTTTKRPFPTKNTTRPNVAPAIAIQVPPEPEDDPTPITTAVVTIPPTTTPTTTTRTSQPPFDREPSEIFPEIMTTTNRGDVAPAMAVPVPPEPEDDPTPATTPSTTTTTTTTTTPPTTTTTTPEPNRVLKEETSPTTTTTKRTIITTPSTTTTKIVTTPTTPTTPYFKAPEYLPPTTPREVPPPQPAMAIPVVPECDPSDPTTYPLGIDQRYSGSDPCNPTTTTPEPNRSVHEEPTTPTTTTTRKVVTTPTKTTTKIMTTPTTPTTPYFKAPEYLPPTTPREGPPPQPAMAIPVVPECDPSDPSTYPLGIDQRYSSSDPCNPTTTTPEPNRSVHEEPTTPTTTTTRKVETTPTTPTTPHFKAPEYLPPLNTTVGPAPARAMPVPEPECDPSDPSTYPLGANPCTIPPACIEPSVLPQGRKKRVARASISGRTLRLADLKGTPRPVWYAGIYDKTYTPHYKPICGGSVLSMDVVLSAAHCFWSDNSLLPAVDFAVGANKIYRPWADKMDKKAQKSDVKEIIVPPRFRGVKTSFQDDIAILKLVTPFRYAIGLRPLCVDFDEDFEMEQLREGHSGTFAGWGATDAAGTPTARLLWLELPYVEIGACIAGYVEDFLKYITSDKMCAGETNTGKALCGGDSGGGLVFWQGQPDNAVPYLRGIASTAPKDDLLECNVQVVGTFTQISWHRRFLRAHVRGLGDECRFRD